MPYIRYHTHLRYPRCIRTYHIATYLLLGMQSDNLTGWMARDVIGSLHDYRNR